MGSRLLGKRPALCASLMGQDNRGFLSSLQIAEGADIIELRADSLRSPGKEEVKGLIKEVKSSTKLPILLTLRPEREGGLFAGREGERLSIIKECAPLVEAVDIELDTAPGKRKVLIKEIRKMGKEVILSSHDFEKTPGEEEAFKILRKELKEGADIAKLAVTPKTKADVFELMNATRKASKLGNVCTTSMGELGRVSRVIAPFYGSCMVYASAGREAGPGQIGVSDMIKLLSEVGLRDDG